MKTIKLNNKQREVELQIVGPDGVMCDFCEEKNKEMVVGSIEQKIEIPRIDWKLVVPDYPIFVDEFGMSLFGNWFIKGGKSPSHIMEYKYVCTGKYETKTFKSHICKDCIKQLAQLLK